DSTKFVRFLNSKEYTYSQFLINLDTAVFNATQDLSFTLTFRLKEGFDSTDGQERAVLLRTIDSQGNQGNYIVVEQIALDSNNYTGWTTVDFTIPYILNPVKQISIIIFANPGDYIDIKSLAILPAVPTNSAELEALSYQQQFEPDENSSSPGDVGTFNYCPSIIIDDDGFAYMYYCTNSGFDGYSFQQGVEDHIGCRKGTPDGNGGYTWGAETLVLSPSNSGWDSQNVCDPSVIKGNFKYNDGNGVKDYTYLMAYLGANNSDNVENETGLAVSNDPMSGWVKVGTTPFIDAPAFDSQLKKDNPNYNQWGEGQPSLVSIDNAGMAYIFWTYGVGEGVNEIHFMEYDFSDLNNIVESDVKVLTAKGLTKYNGAVDHEINNVDFMYDSVNDVFYMVGESHPWTSAIPSDVSQYFRIAYISADELEDGTWTMIGHFKDTDPTFTRSHNAGFLRDAYGHLPANAEFLGVYYTVAYAPDGVTEHNYTLDTYRIHNYFRVIPEALRATEAE
ncbi:MAG: hypothetical protein IKB44_05540, partial [Clostridia bacterium]|nr:hypothetical protein [Clostridia bacterium]